jgi:hypothetical protein
MEDSFGDVIDGDEQPQEAPAEAEGEAEYTSLGVSYRAAEARKKAGFYVQKKINSIILHYGYTSSRITATVLHDLMTIELVGAEEAR